MEEIYQEERPWGNFRQFTKNESSTVKILNLKPDSSVSLQSHNHRHEFWRVISGDGLAEIGEEKIKVEIGSELEIPVQTKHRISSGERGLLILEISFGDFDEDDIVRYEDKYGRV